MNSIKNNKFSYTSYSVIISDLINDELSDSALYKYMAENTDTEKYKMILMQLSADENNHSKNLMREYYRLTGHNYESQKNNSLPDYDSFKSFLEDKIKAEINGFKTYSKLTSTAPNKILESEFKEIALDEAEHAFLLLMILTDLQR